MDAFTMTARTYERAAPLAGALATTGLAASSVTGEPLLPRPVQGPAGQTSSGIGSSGRDPAPGVLRFRNFTLAPRTRELRHDGQAVDIGSRAFDLLTLLVSERGTVVTKDRILAHVWPSTVVDESNLRFQMANLRRALGRDRDLLMTIPGRGYIFRADDAPGWARPSAEPAVHRLSGPARPVPATHAEGRPGDGPAAARKGSALDIALIDEDETVRNALCALLKCMGFTVEGYRGVQDFLEAHPGSEPRCFIMEAWLPGRSGLDFQAELLRAGSRTPVIFISGHADVHMSVRAMKAGAVDFLTKPVRHEELFAAVRSALGREAGRVSG